MVIVAAVDRSDRAGKVIEEAEKLGKQFDESIHVVHVLSDSEYYDLQRTNVQQSGQGVEMEKVEKIATDIAEEMVGQLSVPWEPIGLVGNASERVVDYAAENGARYIVTGPKKQSPTGKALFGSVAQSILLNSSVPVVATVTA